MPAVTAALFQFLGVWSAVLILCVGDPGLVHADEFPPVVNTQPVGDEPPSPAEAAAAITFPDGDPNWHVTLFAGEPDVQQPIAFDFDDRGRVWVAECYSYTSREYDEQHRDRVLIFQDTDGDGQHDERTVFWDRGWMLTGLTWGFGGLWVLNDGTLSFIPDVDGDDVPDSEPVVMLDGWTFEAQHNVVNGLLWGPDGWLYGRHGITDTSYPGTPETPQAERQPMNCGIWRFHPTRKVFEVVCRGTTNPWGLDYDEHGQMFFTNNVVGHLWHAIPGAHYTRMFGQDFNPHLYALIDQHADHYHWDTTGNWTQSRDGAANDLGGGHSHCGAMIYLGDNWPAQYRGSLLMCNTHGRRVNRDRLEREGSGYVGRHAGDFLLAGQPWFRGVELKYGPDGGVYLSDWADNGECHDHDGVHRTSGRIYKIRFGRPVEQDASQSVGLDLAGLTNEQLVERLTSRNEWYVRHAQRLLQERAAQGQLPESLREYLVRWRNDVDLNRMRLRLLWTLSVTGGCDERLLLRCLDSVNEDERAWGVRLLAEEPSVSPDARAAFARMARDDDSGIVRLTLASTMQRLPEEARWPIAGNLAAHAEDAADHNLPLMIWYGIEPAVPGNPERAVALARDTQIPLLREFIARRLVAEVHRSQVAVGELLVLSASRDDKFRRDVLNGVTAGLEGLSRAEAPPDWEQVAEVLSHSEAAEIRGLARDLSVLFGDGRALDAVRKLAADPRADPQTREQAIRTLGQAGDDVSVPLLHELLGDKAVSMTALQSLASFDHPQTAHVILGRWDQLRHGLRPIAVDVLSSRESYALLLIQALREGRAEAADLSADQVRQLRALGNEEIDNALDELWGVTRSTPAERQKLIDEWKERLSPESLAAVDLSRGRELFKKNCGNCHRLYGEGGQVGPDITGSNRSNLDYLLLNILDPSATVPKQFTTSVILRTDGRVITGVVVQRTEQSLTVQTEKELMVVPQSDVEATQESEQSLMPEGLLKQMSEADVRDLIGYLQSRTQVALP